MDDIQYHRVQRLWIAVLMQACADFLTEHHRFSALYWFNSKRENEGSFIWICRMLNQDPDKMRTKLTTLRKHPSRGRLMERYGVNRKRETGS